MNIRIELNGHGVLDFLRYFYRFANYKCNPFSLGVIIQNWKHKFPIDQK